MTDTQMLIRALRDCADRLQRCAVMGGTERQFAVEAVREYRQLADLCEGRLPDAEIDT